MSKCEWRSAWDEDYRCRVAAEAGSEFCIFHEPGEKDIERFKQAFYSQIREEGPADERNPKYDFRGYVFPTGLAVHSEKAELILPKEIGGELIMEESTIKGDANFEEATFKGDASFGGATFEENADFRDVKIEGDAGFAHTEIGKNAQFEGAKIEGYAFFWGARIGGNAEFANATIGTDAVFRNAEIRGHTLFWNAEIRGDADFQSAKVGETLAFWGAKVGQHAEFRGAKIGGSAYFRNAAIGGWAVFSDVTFAGQVFFENCQASALDLGKGRPTILPIVRNRCGVTLAAAYTGVSFWRFARLTLAKEGRKEEADAAHYFERIWRWRTLRKIPPTKGCWWERAYQAVQRGVFCIQWFLECLFVRWPTAYGTSLSRLLTTWAVLIGSFATAYYMLALRGAQLFDVASPGLQWPFSFGSALYFSTITFTTLGYGDIRPMPGLGRALTATEAILGGIMMALTVLVIGRKFMR